MNPKKDIFKPQNLGIIYKEDRVEINLYDDDNHLIATLAINYSINNSDKQDKTLSQELNMRRVLKLDLDITVQSGHWGEGIGTNLMQNSPKYIDDLIQKLGGVDNFDTIFTYIYDVSTDPETKKLNGWSGRAAANLGFTRMSDARIKRIFSERMLTTFLTRPNDVWIKFIKG